MCADTEILPVVSTGYALRTDRCVIEVAWRPLGIPVARLRLRASGGTIIFTDGTETLAIQVDATRTRSRHGRFRLTGNGTRAQTEPVPLNCEVEIGGDTWSLPLTARFVHVADDAIVLAVRGPVRPPKGTSIIRRSWIWVAAAAEFPQ